MANILPCSLFQFPLTIPPLLEINPWQIPEAILIKDLPAFPSKKTRNIKRRVMMVCLDATFWHQGALAVKRRHVMNPATMYVSKRLIITSSQ